MQEEWREPGLRPSRRSGLTFWLGNLSEPQLPHLHTELVTTPLRYWSNGAMNLEHLVPSVERIKWANAGRMFTALLHIAGGNHAFVSPLPRWLPALLTLMKTLMSPWPASWSTCANLPRFWRLTPACKVVPSTSKWSKPFLASSPWSVGVE